MPISGAISWADEVFWGYEQENPAFRRVFGTQFIPDATVELLRAFEDMMQISASAANVIRLNEAFSTVDLRNLAPKINIPTLVIHCRDDAVVAFEQGRRLASLIPNARFMGLDSRNHIIMRDEPAWGQFVKEIRQFLVE